MSYNGKSGRNNDFFLSAASLLLEYRLFIDSHAPLSALNIAYPAWPSMVNYCEEIEQQPELMRAITRLHACSQIDFERALFCSWMSLLVARYLNLAEAHQRSLFLAGLVQDLGKHAVEDEIKGFLEKVNKPVNLPGLESRCGDSHPLVSSTFVERMISDDAISDLVLHHHARFDGTGYPQNVGESQLDLDHQILVIVNEISDRLDSAGGHNTLPACLPVLRVNSYLYFQKAYSAWHDMLNPHFEVVIAESNAARIRLSLIRKRDKLEKALGCLIALSGELLSYDFDIYVHGLRSIIQKLAHLFTDAGVLNKELFLCQEKPNVHLVGEMENLFKGIPDVLARCNDLIQTLKSMKKYNLNHALLGEASLLLQSCIEDLGVKKPSIFR